MFEPATKPVIEPPSLVAALTAASDDMFSFPSLCSRTARVDNRRASEASRDKGEVILGERFERACRKAEFRSAENMVVVDVDAKEGKLSVYNKRFPAL